MAITYSQHANLTLEDIHALVRWEVVNTAARLALEVIEADNNKVCHQTDNNSYWVLADYAGPTWVEFTSAGTAAVTSVFGEIGDVSESDANFTAADIANVAAGTIAATNVQSAINELDAEKTPLTHTHVLSQVTDAGTAAAEDVGVATGDVPQLEDVGGSPGLPAVDGSQLTGVAGGGSAIEVEDDVNGVLTTDVTKFTFVGDGVTATNPVDEEITVTIAPGAAPIDTVFGRTGTVIAFAGDYTASEVTNVAAGDIVATDVQAAIDELDTDKAASTDTRFPTTDEKGALAGTGAPSGSNRYVTDNDSRLDDSRAPTGAASGDLTGTYPSPTLGTDAIQTVNIEAGQVTLIKMDAGTPGGVIAYDTTTGNPVDVGAGTQDQVLMSNASGVASWEDNTASGTMTVEEEGTPVTGGPHGAMNFIGGGVTASDGGGGTVDVTIAPGAAPIDTVFGRTGTVIAWAGDYTAAEITNAPSGDIAAITVQSAIDELDTEKAAVGHTQVYGTVDGVPTDTFLGRDAAGTGAAEALNTTEARSLLNVEDGSVAAGTAGDAYATNHEADATAHTAAEIVNTPAGDIAATNVQAALDELDTDKSATGHAHTLSDVSDSGTAAALDAGVTIGDLVELENVGGNPGMPAVDGSQLTGVAGTGSAITVQDDSTTHTTDVTLFKFSGGGVTVTEPVADEVTVTIAPGAAPIDTVFTRTGAVVAEADDYAASLVINDSSVTGAYVDDALDTLDSDFSGHTHDTLANIATDSILGRVTGGSGLSEELTGAQAAGLLDHADIGAGIGTNTHAQIDTHVDGDGSDHADVSANTTKLDFITVTEAVDLDTIELLDNPGIGEFTYDGINDGATADPGTGKWKTNTANTRIEINYDSLTGLDTSDVIDAMQAGVHLYLRSLGEDRTYLVQVVTDETTYFDLTVVLAASSTGFAMTTSERYSFHPIGRGDDPPVEGASVLATGATGAYVLTADGANNASWQPSLPNYSSLSEINTDISTDQIANIYITDTDPVASAVDGDVWIEVT